jgi:4-amino-4-deoxy-L-arabinose transferase-like glycosyltransferase
LLHKHVATGKRWIEIGETYPVLSGGFVLLLGIALSWYYFGSVYPRKTAIFGPAGQETRGSIVDMREEENHNSASTYSASISFQDAAGNSHLIQATYDFVHYYALRDDRVAVVRYLKSDPSQAVEIHSRQGERPSVVWYAFQCVLLLGIGGVLILYGRARSAPEEPDARTIRAAYGASTRRPRGGPLA